MAWVFWLVVAVGAIGWFAWRARSRLGRQRSLMLLCRRAGLLFAPDAAALETAWLPFPMFGPSVEHGFENAIRNAGDQDGTQVFDVWYRSRAEGDEPISGASTTRLTCGVVRLPFGCPRLDLAPRGATDLVADAIGGERVELELDAFNERFRVVSDDRRFAVAFLDQRMMRSLMALPPDVSVAVNEDTMLLTAPQMPPGEMLLLLEVARTLRHRVPSVVASLYPPRPTRGPHEGRWMQGHWSPDPIGDDR
jgi:hypothetical protein